MRSRPNTRTPFASGSIDPIRHVFLTHRGDVADAHQYARAFGADEWIHERDAVAGIVPPATRVDVRLVWDPPWTPDKMTGIAREHFGWTF